VIRGADRGKPAVTAADVPEVEDVLTSEWLGPGKRCGA
jgi:hypothetical protein